MFLYINNVFVIYSVNYRTNKWSRFDRTGISAISCYNTTLLFHNINV